MSTLDQFIASHFDNSTETGPLLSELMTKGAAKGIPLQQLKKKIFPLCEEPEIQEKWSNWNNITDREEVRLRLMAMNSFQNLHSSLVPFVLFYFRASDSVLYQTAAQIAGKQLPHQPDIQSYLSSYLKERNVDPEKPVKLNGQRSQRRLLVLFSACYANNGPDTELSGDKITLAPPLGALSEKEDFLKNRMDYSAMMLSCSLLTGTKSAPDNKILKRMLQLPKSVSDRNIIRNWGLLLNSYNAPDDEKTGFLYHALERSAELFENSETYPAKLQVLYRSDEIIRSGVFVLQGKTDNLIPDTADKELARFFEIQYHHWRAREVAATNTLPKNDIGSEVLDRIAAAPLTNRMQETLFVTLLQSLQSEQSWRLQPLNERLWKTFFLIDMAIHNHFISSDEMRQQLTGLGSEKEYGVYDKPRVTSPLSIILRRLLHLEQTARGSLADGRLIHKVADEQLLLALLPTGSNSELLPVLADAIEHQIRLLMETDSTFNPDLYLYRITIREPHKNFYRYLTELIRNRTYGTGEDKGESFRLKLEYLTADHTGEEPAPKMNELLNKSLFWSSLQKIRSRQEAHLKNDDLFSLLDHLQNEIDGTGQEQLSQTATLHDLLNIVHNGEPHWLRSGFPANWNRPASILNQRMDQLNRQLKLDAEKIKPATLEDVHEAAEAAQRIRETLDELEKLTSPSLGGTEAALFSAIKHRTKDLLSRWVEVLLSAETVWQIYDDQTPGKQHNFWNNLFKTANRSDNPFIQNAMQHIVLNSILHQRDGEGKKPWVARYQFLTWATQKMDKENSHLLELLRNVWSEMLQEAIDKKQEARVVQLVKASELKILRRSDSVTPQLELVKNWCFERYDLLHAFECNREINPEINFVSNRWKTLRQYFAHFSQVWIALIIGVTLMFDFGDPWTELAEIGDGGGVIFTFLLAVGGTYLYVFSDLRKKVNLVKSDPFQWASQFGRVGIFLAITLAFTILVVLLFYYMFYNTDQVVHGPYAIWHIIAWTGFALFIGVFFGLIGREDPSRPGQ